MLQFQKEKQDKKNITEENQVEHNQILGNPEKKAQRKKKTEQNLKDIADKKRHHNVHHQHIFDNY